MKKLCKNIVWGLMLAVLPASGAPKVHCPEPVFNFGDLSNHEKVRHVFKLKNSGDEVLRFGSIRAACGCTTVELNVKEVSPGETADLVVVFDLDRRYGHQDKWINVTTNDPEHRVFQLRMQGNAIADIQRTPENLFEKAIKPGQAVQRTVRIHAVEGVSFNITTIKPTLDQVNTRLETIEKGKVYDLHVEIPPQTGAKQFYENIMVITDYGGLPYFSVQVRAQVVAPVQVSPNPVKLSQPPPGSTVTRFMTVRAGAVEEFEVTGAEWPDERAKVEILPPTKFGTRIRISGIVVDDQLRGRELVIKTTAPDAEVIKIPIIMP